MERIKIVLTIIIFCSLTSCYEILGPQMQVVLYRLTNNSADYIGFSFYAHAKGDIDNQNFTCIKVKKETIMPFDSIGGSLDFYGEESNSWVDYFNTEKIDTFYVIISATPIEAKEGQKYDALPGGSNVLKIYKYTKESFYDYNPETDVAAFVYP